MAKLCQQITKWQRLQSLDKLRGLKESKDFSVNVNVKGDNNLSLSITCKICGKQCFLSCKGEHILLSNWTRHVNSCVKKVPVPITKGSKIKDYFLSASKVRPDLSTSSCVSSSPSPQSISENGSLISISSPTTSESEGSPAYSSLPASNSLLPASKIRINHQINSSVQYGQLASTNNKILFGARSCSQKKDDEIGSNIPSTNSNSTLHGHIQFEQNDASCVENDQQLCENPTCLQTNLNVEEGSLNSNTSNNVSSDDNPHQCEQNNQLVVHMNQASVDNPCCSQLYPDTEIKINTDWSWSTRKKLLLLKSASDPAQTRITSFFNLIDSVNSILSSKPEINHLIQDSTTGRSVSFSPLFKCLIQNAERNLEKVPQQVRHSTLLKKFATSLLIYCGPMAYNFISCNLPRALPCLRTVQRNIAAEYSPFQEGVFRFDELLDHLNSFNAAKLVFWEKMLHVLYQGLNMMLKQISLLDLYCHVIIMGYQFATHFLQCFLK